VELTQEVRKFERDAFRMHVMLCRLK
jgi:hypothetical protein